MERRDLSQLKEALHAAELDGISFGLSCDKITLPNGHVLNAEDYVRTRVKNTLRSAIAAPITSVLAPHGWNGEY